MTATTAVGIDIGGTGIKAAIVDLERGKLASARVRVRTPDPPAPQPVVDAIRHLLDDVDAQGAEAPDAVGVGFPGVIRGSVIETAANLDPAWVGIDGVGLLSEAIGHPTRLINDADAAGMAEVRFGAGSGVDGVVLMLTLGTGIGSGLFVDGTLVPNTELGHLEVGGEEAEARASAAARKAGGLSWEDWGRELDVVLREFEKLFWPDLVVLGGGASKRFDRFAGQLTCHAPVVPAALGNNAGIIGAALHGANSA